MRLQIVTTNRRVLDSDVEEVYMPGVLGQTGILPDHTTFLTILEAGEVRYREGGRDRFVAVSGGVADVVNDNVTILADAAELAAEINVDRARVAEKNALALLGRTQASEAENADAQGALARARARLSASGRLG